MNSLELIRKAQRVVNSCLSMEQLNIGRRYLKLTEKILRASKSTDLMRATLELEATYGQKVIELYAKEPPESYAHIILKRLVQ